MRKRKLILAFCFLCTVLLFAACGKDHEVENNITSQPEGTPAATTNPVSTKNPQPTQNPWISEPDWVEKPTEPAKDFFPGALTGEEKKTESRMGNTTSFGYLCESEGYIYYIDIGRDNTLLCKESIHGDGNRKQVLADEKNRCFFVNVLGDYVYYATEGKIKRIHKDGGEAEVLWSEGVNGIAVTEDKIYITSDGVYSMNPDGSDARRLTARGAVKGDDNELASIAVYRDYVLYLARRDNRSLYAVKNDGTEEYLLQEGVTWPSMAGDCVYYRLREDALGKHPEFQESDVGKMIEFSLLTGEKRIVSEKKGVYSNVIGDKLYYSDYYAIRSVSLTDGTDKALYPENQDDRKELLKNFFDQLHITSNRLYYVAGGVSGSLYYIDLETGETGSMK